MTESPISSTPEPSRPPQVAAIPSPTPPPATLSQVGGLSDIYFDFDRFVLRRDAIPVLEADARAIKERTGRQVLIEGHCDERGTEAYNLVLGERRARETQQYLKDLGVPSSQIEIVSYGEERPFCTEHREPCWQKNRRAHFVLK